MATSQEVPSFVAAKDEGVVLRRMDAAAARWPELVSMLRPHVERGHLYDLEIRAEDDIVAAAASVRELSPRELAEFIEAFLPEIAPAAITAWSAQSRRPYQRGETRRPFRCPRSEEVSSQRRMGWLLTLARILHDTRGDVVWLAEHAQFLDSFFSGPTIGWLLAGALDRRDAEAARVLETLRSIVTGVHPFAHLGRAVTGALLCSERRECWELVEKLLLAAQREEGLRQVIFESIDEAHPEAFAHFLRVALEHDLGRFSSFVRAFDTWFGFWWDGAARMTVARDAERVLAMLDEPEVGRQSLLDGSATDAYFALWVAAFRDVDAAVELARDLLGDADADRRFVAVHLLVQTLWSSSLEPLLPRLDDVDLRVAVRARDAFLGDCSEFVDPVALFEALERLIGRSQKRATPAGKAVWPWWALTLERSAVAEAMLANANAATQARFRAYVEDLEPTSRARWIREMAGLKPRWEVSGALAPKRRIPTGKDLALVLDFLGDPSEDVRSVAFEALEGAPVSAAEVDRLVELSKRKSGDLRSRSIARLRGLSDDELLAVADRLLAAKEAASRTVGLELLRDAFENGRTKEAVQERASAYAGEHEQLSDEERLHLEALANPPSELATLDDALGLADPKLAIDWPAPRALAVTIDTPAAAHCIEELAALVLERAAVEVRSFSGEMQPLLDCYFFNFSPRHLDEDDDGAKRVPLFEVWKDWSAARGPATRDADGLELIRALASCVTTPIPRAWAGPRAVELREARQFSKGVDIVKCVLEWAIHWEQPNGGAELALDLLEASLAAMTADDRKAIASSGDGGYGLYHERVEPWRKKVKVAADNQDLVDVLLKLLQRPPAGAHARSYALLRRHQLDTCGKTSTAPHFGNLLAAIDDGAFGSDAAAANEFITHLVGRHSAQCSRDFFHETSGVAPHADFARRPLLVAAMERCRRRIAQIETKRGDRPTVASPFVPKLRWTGGLETLTQALGAIGRGSFARTSSWFGGDKSREQNLSHLVLRSRPADDETPEHFAAWRRTAKTPEKRLVELAAYAPQWARHVAEALGWPQLVDAVWWMHAHTKDDRWSLREMREEWAAAISERTPLASDDLVEGAVDVEWFARVHAELGPERWKKLHDAAKYASGSNGHTRAQLFARAMTGEVTVRTLLVAIDAKRHQDSVRALGLVPLATGAERDHDVLARYRRLHDFIRESRKFGSMRQESEKRAARIGLENLARTAGFKDPLRLQWALELESVRDLVGGPVTIVRGDVEVALGIDEDGAPWLRTTRRGQTIKEAPATLKKDEAISELRERAKDLRRQFGRVRDALEEAMCRGDLFDADELRTLMGHPVLAPRLARLVFVSGARFGYPTKDGGALVDHGGRSQALEHGASLRIAHPHDLLRHGDWPEWQRECLRAERLQPFKQVFRELYVTTAAERGEALRSDRYAGHQVQPRQALALLSARGWVAKPEDGITKTFHRDGLTAHLELDGSFLTPAEVEGLTLDGLVFRKRASQERLRLDAIPPRVFSETMRDLDLVVSVAHRGGVDPEASTSTVEMRAALLRETCRLLSLDNVQVQEHSAIVRGRHATYSLHLGSAVIRILGGPALVVVAVHSQHRGRLFLPFADDDPRTAEVLAKALMLARDHELKDPKVLDQIHSR